MRVYYTHVHRDVHLVDIHTHPLSHHLSLSQCKVLCGKQEKLKDSGAKGSTQFEPSSEKYDSGVDNLSKDAHQCMYVLIQSYIKKAVCVSCEEYF